MQRYIKERKTESGKRKTFVFQFFRLELESGKLTEEAGYFATGVLEYKYLYDYDAKGKLTKMTECDLDNRPMRSITYCYDAEGRVSEEIVCDDNNLESRWLYHYDTNGNVVKIEPSDNKNIVTKFEIVYRKLAYR